VPLSKGEGKRSYILILITLTLSPKEWGRLKRFIFSYLSNPEGFLK
jgi:hypothetical protein